MIEIQISDDKLYEEFREQSTYYSDRTKVLELPDYLKDELEAKGLLNDKSKFIVQESYSKPVVKVHRDGTLEVIGLGEDLVVRCALGINSPNGVYVKVQDFDLVLDMARLGVVELDEKSFDAHMPYLPARTAKFSDLLFSGVKFRDIGSLNQATQDPETKESPVIGRTLNGRFELEEFQPHVVEVVAESQIKVNWGYGILAKRLKSGSGGGFVRIQLNNSQVVRELLNQKASFAIWSKYPIRESVTSPLIVPIGTQVQNIQVWKRTDRRRDIPSVHLRNAWIEYNYRRNK